MMSLSRVLLSFVEWSWSEVVGLRATALFLLGLKLFNLADASSSFVPYHGRVKAGFKDFWLLMLINLHWRLVDLFLLCLRCELLLGLGVRPRDVRCHWILLLGPEVHARRGHGVFMRGLHF